MMWKKLKYLLPSYRRAQEREMQDELESLAQIATPGELGSLTLAAEGARETWSWTWLEGLWADCRFAIRSLRRAAVFTVVAVLSVALGIGANSAIFSFADALLLRPLPVARPAEVLSISGSTPDKPKTDSRFPTTATCGITIIRSPDWSRTGRKAWASPSIRRQLPRSD